MQVFVLFMLVFVWLMFTSNCDLNFCRWTTVRKLTIVWFTVGYLQLTSWQLSEISVSIFHKAGLYGGMLPNSVVCSLMFDSFGFRSRLGNNRLFQDQITTEIRSLPMSEIGRLIFSLFQSLTPIMSTYAEESCQHDSQYASLLQVAHHFVESQYYVRSMEGKFKFQIVSVLSQCCIVVVPTDLQISLFLLAQRCSWPRVTGDSCLDELG